MNSNEKRGMIAFPSDGSKAVNVPQDTVEFKLSSGAVSAKNDDDFYEELNQELDTAFQQVRSMLIFVEVPAEVQGIYENPLHLEAGWTPLQEIPETEEFKMDFRKLNRGMIPADVQVKVLMFNTATLPLPDGERTVSVGKDKKTSVGTGSYEDLMALPVDLYEESRFKIYNEGSNPADIKITTFTAGNSFPEEIDTDSTPVTRTVEPDEYGTVVVKTPAQFAQMEAKASNGSTTLRTEFIGEK